MPRRERAITDMAIQWPMLRVALRIIRRDLGILALLSVLMQVAKNHLCGEPWKGLPAGLDEKDRLSRQEIGGAVLLFRALRKRLDTDAAMALLQEIVVEGAILSFEYLLDPLTPAELRALPRREREERVRRNLERFPNADARVDEVAPDRLAFTVMHCRFPALLAATGHPELAPLFCAGDQRYFEERLGLAFSRAHTIALGSAECPFVLATRTQEDQP